MNLALFDFNSASKPEKVEAQTILRDAGFYADEIDGSFGPKSKAALQKWDAKQGLHRVRASSFADPVDIAAYRAAKARGESDAQAFRHGDNGIGLWGDDCSQGSGPRCALPREDWVGLKKPRGAKVEVAANGCTVTVELRDTMPARRYITNGAGVDLNPDAVVALGLTPPIMVPATWRWV